MPAFIAALLAWLGPVLVSSVGKVLAALGIGVISYAGISTLTDSLFAYVESNMAGIPYAVIQFIAMFKMMTAVNMICSAYVGKFAIEGIKKLVIK